MGKLQNEAYLATSRALDRDRRKNSIGAILGLLFIIAAVVALCWYGLENNWI